MEIYDKINNEKVILLEIRVIGLTKETFLKFTSEGEKLRLESYIRIKDIKEANASLNSGKFKLDIVTAEQTGKNKYYFGGDEADL